MVRSQAPHAPSNLGKGGINNNDTSKLIHGAKKLGHRLLTLDTPTLDTPTRSDTTHASPCPTTLRHRSDTGQTPPTPSTPVSIDTAPTLLRHYSDTSDTSDTQTHQGSSPCAPSGDAVFHKSRMRQNQVELLAFGPSAPTDGESRFCTGPTEPFG